MRCCVKTLPVIVYDNSFADEPCRRVDPRFKFYDMGGDILQNDMLEADSAWMVSSFASWLLQCYEYPRSAFDVNVLGTFNVMEVVSGWMQRLVYRRRLYGDAISEPMTEEHPLITKIFTDY